MSSFVGSLYLLLLNLGCFPSIFFSLLLYSFMPLGVILAPLTFSRENNRNEEEEEEKQKNEEEEEGNNRIYIQGRGPTRIIFNIVYY